MSEPTGSIWVLLFSLFTFGSAEPAAKPAPAATASCHIERQGQVYTAFATSAQPLAGSFSLELRLSGANTATVRQKGAFALSAGDPQPLASARMGGGPLSGTMTLEWADGRTECRL